MKVFVKIFVGSAFVRNTFAGSFSIFVALAEFFKESSDHMAAFRLKYAAGHMNLMVELGHF